MNDSAVLSFRASIILFHPNPGKAGACFTPAFFSVDLTQYRLTQ